MKEIEQLTDYGLLKGTSAETSGGLLIILPKNKAKGFIKEFKVKYGLKSWIIGKVIKGNNSAYLKENFTISEC